jgi:hypothetical protein
MQIKATMGYHMTTARLAIILKNKKIASDGKDMEKREDLHTVGNM